MPDYDTLDAMAMAKLVRQREVPADHFIKEADSRAKAVNPALNTVIHEFAPMESANLDGPFAGVPLFLKDTGVSINGEPLTAGSRLQADVRSSSDSTVGKRLRNAGFVFMG